MSGGDLVVGRLYGVTALGHYQVAMAIPIMIGIRAMSVISQISLPTYAMLQKDRPGAMRALSLQMGLTGMVIVPSALATATLAPYLVPFVFGPSWTAAIDPLRVLCLFAIAAAFCSVMAAFHCGANHPELQTKIWAVMCVCYVAMVIPFTMMWGLVGAAWAISLTFVIGLVLHVRATVQLLGREAWPAFEPLRWAGGVGGDCCARFTAQPYSSFDENGAVAGDDMWARWHQYVWMASLGARVSPLADLVERLIGRASVFQGHEVDVSIIIVNWNTRDLLRSCLQALASGIGGVRAQVLVVDNGSIDGSPVLGGGRISMGGTAQKLRECRLCPSQQSSLSTSTRALCIVAESGHRSGRWID